MSLTTWPELREWLAGAREQFRDPSEPVGQLFVRWHAAAGSPQDLICTYTEGMLVLLLGPDVGEYPLLVAVGDMRLDEQGRVETYGVRRIAPGVWALIPSLNDVGRLHAYIILYGVPDPAPFVTAIRA